MVSTSTTKCTISVRVVMKVVFGLEERRVDVQLSRIGLKHYGNGNLIPTKENQGKYSSDILRATQLKYAWIQ
jgi:hypothetical protein